MGVKVDVAGSPQVRNVFKVIQKSPDEEIVHFDTSKGDSDSYLDARKSFMNVWYQVRSNNGGGEMKESIVQLFQDNELKAEESLEKHQQNLMKKPPTKTPKAAKAPKTPKKSKKTAKAVEPKEPVASTDETSKEESNATKVQEKKLADKPESDNEKPSGAAKEGEEDVEEAEVGKPLQGNASGPKESKKKTAKCVLLDASGEPIKPAQTAYLHFCHEARPSVMDELRAVAKKAPEKGGDDVAEGGMEGGEVKISPGEVMTTLGAQWRALDDTEKSRFKEMAVRDKARYDDAVVSNPDNEKILIKAKADARADRKSQCSGKGAKKRARAVMVDENGSVIKKPNTSYAFYVSEHSARARAAIAEQEKEQEKDEDGAHAAGKEGKKMNVFSYLSGEWKQLTPDDKAKYETMAKLDRTRFEKAMETATQIETELTTQEAVSSSGVEGDRSGDGGAGGIISPPPGKKRRPSNPPTPKTEEQLAKESEKREAKLARESKKQARKIEAEGKERALKKSRQSMASYFKVKAVTTTAGE